MDMIDVNAKDFSATPEMAAARAEGLVIRDAALARWASMLLPKVGISEEQRKATIEALDAIYSDAMQSMGEDICQVLDTVNQDLNSDNSELDVDVFEDMLRTSLLEAPILRRMRLDMRTNPAHLSPKTGDGGYTPVQGTV